MAKKKKIGQITLKRIGKKYAVCISGDPQELFESFDRAEEWLEKTRKEYGRRHYSYWDKKNKCKLRNGKQKRT